MTKLEYRLVGSDVKLVKTFSTEQEAKQWAKDQGNVVIISLEYEGKAAANKLNSLFGF